MQKVVIVGAGGFGREVFDLIKDINRARGTLFEVMGFVADDQPDTIAINRIGLQYLGNLDTAIETISDFSSWGYVIAIGDGQIRHQINNKLEKTGLIPISLVHPSVQIGSNVNIGVGSIICANSILTTNIQIGAGSQINLACVIGHDVILGEFVTLSPAVNLMGGCSIGNASTVFTGSTILPRIEVKQGSVVGAGSVVTKDIEARTLVVGNPARVVRKI
jgi:sugar O-acyltransferase (sialic acid O-acetyltransferase NeuD family)